LGYLTKTTVTKTDKLNAGSDDVALVCGRTSDGLAILRQREQRLEAGIVKPLEEGKAIHGEVLQLKQRGNTPLYDVTVLVDHPERNKQLAPKLSHKTQPASFGEERGHPALVASDTYRSGWDAIWKRPPGDDELLN
jgi:hypothetical protein